MMKRLTGAVALAGLAVSAAGCGMSIDFGPGGAKTEDRHYEVPGALNRLDVRIDSADLEIIGTGTDTVKVRERLKYTKSNKPAPEHRIEGQTLVLRYKCPDGLRVGFNQCNVSYRIEVPRRFAVKVADDSGAVSATGVHGGIDADIDSGSLRGTDLGGGKVTARLDSAGVRLSGAGDLNIRLDSGSVVADDLHARRVNFSVESGAVTLRYAARATPPESITGRIDSGGIKLTVPDTAQGYNIDATHDSGSVNYDDSLDNGQSPYVIKLFADSGSVRIDTL